MFNPISRAMTHHLSSLVPFARTPAQLQGSRVLSRLTGPAWDPCDGVEPEDAATDDGVNVILDTLADAFQGEHEKELLMPWRTLSMDKQEEGRETPRLRTTGTEQRTRACQARSTAARPRAGIHFTASGEPEHSSPYCHDDAGGQLLVFWRCEEGMQAIRRLRDPKEHDAHKSHTVYVSQAKEASVTAEEQDGDTDVETALAALNEDNDTDLGETDVQEILSCKESRQLRGEQRVNRCKRLWHGVPVAESFTELRVDSTQRMWWRSRCLSSRVSVPSLRKMSPRSLVVLFLRRSWMWKLLCSSRKSCGSHSK